MATVKPRKRTRPRVEQSEQKSAGAATKSAKHKGFEPPSGFITLTDKELYIGAQLSELVPVAQYANVTIGPVQLAWKLGNVDMEALMEVDWEAIEDSDDIAKLPERARNAWERARRGLRATMMLIEFTIAEDRDTVERSVQQHNEREAAEKKKS
jgi:hypothetical protein